MSDQSDNSRKLRVTDLRQNRESAFEITLTAQERAALATELGALSLRKLRFDGVMKPQGAKGWRLEAALGATVQQACIATLEPVTTRIDTKVVRSFLPAHLLETPDEGSETELTDDETDPLPDVIDLYDVMAEALSLAMPTYPRKDDADPADSTFAAPGVTPMGDDDVKPFAGLAALREKMQGNEGND